MLCILVHPSSSVLDTRSELQVRNLAESCEMATHVAMQMPSQAFKPIFLSDIALNCLLILLNQVDSLGVPTKGCCFLLDAAP